VNAKVRKVEVEVVVKEEVPVIEMVLTLPEAVALYHLLFGKEWYKVNQMLAMGEDCPDPPNTPTGWLNQLERQLKPALIDAGLDDHLPVGL
jgi:hypothetical protein